MVGVRGFSLKVGVLAENLRIRVDEVDRANSPKLHALDGLLFAGFGILDPSFRLQFDRSSRN